MAFPWSLLLLQPCLSSLFHTCVSAGSAACSWTGLGITTELLLFCQDRLSSHICYTVSCCHKMQCRCCPRFLSLETVLWVTGQGIKEYPALVIHQLGLLHALKFCSFQLCAVLVSLARDAIFEKALLAKLSSYCLSTKVCLDTQKVVFNMLSKCPTGILIFYA